MVGVPAHAWCRQTASVIPRGLGYVVGVDEDTAGRIDMADFRVWLRTDRPRRIPSRRLLFIDEPRRTLWSEADGRRSAAGRCSSAFWYPIEIRVLPGIMVDGDGAAAPPPPPPATPSPTSILWPCPADHHIMPSRAPPATPSATAGSRCAAVPWIRMAPSLKPLSRTLRHRSRRGVIPAAAYADRASPGHALWRCQGRMEVGREPAGAGVERASAARGAARERYFFQDRERTLLSGFYKGHWLLIQ